MNTRFVTATIVVGVLFIASCKWFSPGKTASSFNIVGKWNLDLVVPGKDTSKAFGWALYFMSRDTAKQEIHFYNDSTYTDVSNNKGKYYITEKKLYVTDSDSLFIPLQINVLNNSSITLYMADSSRLHLRRK